MTPKEGPGVRRRRHLRHRRDFSPRGRDQGAIGCGLLCRVWLFLLVAAVTSRRGQSWTSHSARTLLLGFFRIGRLISAKRGAFRISPHLPSPEDAARMDAIHTDSHTRSRVEFPKNSINFDKFTGFFDKLNE